ncbi:MAG: type IV-A pilus assembly ATPase PilB [Pontibacterium sp.]
MSQAFQPLSGLAKRLVGDGIFSADAASKASIKARESQQTFIAYVVENNMVSASKAASAAADEFGMPLLDLDALDLDTLPQGIIEDALISKHHALPLHKRGNRLFVAISDPTNTQALDVFKFHSGTPTEAVIVEEDKLVRAMDSFLDKRNAALDGLEDADLDNLEVEEKSPADDDDPTTGDNEAPIVRFVNKVLVDAIKNGASDIHFEPYEKSYRVRCRIDGMLQEVSRPPVNLASRLAARIKVMSQMDISERRMPQDGRIKMRLSKSRAIDFRVNTLPTLWGEKIVLRILDPSSAKMGIEALGFSPQQKDLYQNILHKPQGMILVTGPTGSGKTVSLYTGLNILNTEERNISTAEDPVEINLEGINQVHVNTKVGLTFAEALRSFLRQDPDVVMVGEIRDIETAEIAVKAAQTGHMVLSTLHTNSAAETLTRLRNMGVPPFNIATSVTLIIAQRLARRLCNACKTPLSLPEEALVEEGFTPEQLGELQLFEANKEGCPKCNKGFKGRVGIYEMMPMSDELAGVIMSNGSSLDILAKASEEGFKTLRQSGIEAVAKGITSLDEINRVIKT